MGNFNFKAKNQGNHTSTVLQVESEESQKPLSVTPVKPPPNDITHIIDNVLEMKNENAEKLITKHCENIKKQIEQRCINPYILFTLEITNEDEDLSAAFALEEMNNGLGSNASMFIVQNALTSNINRFYYYKLVFIPKGYSFTLDYSNLLFPLDPNLPNFMQDRSFKGKIFGVNVHGRVTPSSHSLTPMEIKDQFS